MIEDIGGNAWWVETTRPQNAWLYHSWSWVTKTSTQRLEFGGLIVMENQRLTIPAGKTITFKEINSGLTIKAGGTIDNSGTILIDQ